MKTVKEIAKMSGVSVRTLHYYDEIGLLKPTDMTQKGYRLYDDQKLKILRQIILFKEMGIGLKRIKSIISKDDYDYEKVLESQKKMLEIKMNRLKYLIEQIDEIKSGNNSFHVSNQFSESEWELMWNEIYKNQGEVQFDVLPPVKTYIDYLKDRNLLKILDLGCGTGRNTMYLLENGFQVTATDISEQGLKLTQKKAKSRSFELETACHDMRQIPFKDNTFDALLCSWVCGHGNHQDMIEHANEMLRVVKPGGSLFVDYPSTADARFGIGIEIEDNTFLENMPGEEKIPHHYSDLKEIETVYKDHDYDIKPYTYEFYDKENNCHHIEAYIVIINKG